MALTLPTLDDISAPEDVMKFGLTSLAWLTHEAELAEDDIIFIWIQNEVNRRGGTEIYNREYLRLWPEHARIRNYSKEE